MATLTCDICGGLLSMDSSGDFAVCESCGMRHTKERVRAKAQEITGTVKIDDTDAVKEQLSNWEKMANDAFNNSNYSEAYTYYCKILEKDVENWFATYRKGMCMGWKATLNNMRTNEVIGGVVDAKKLLLVDERETDSSRANAFVTMAKEVYRWIFALSNLVYEHRREYGEELVSAAQNYYEQEQIIALLIGINIDMITEFTYRNCENKWEIEELADNICSLGRTTCLEMRHSFRIKTGSQWNSFWLKYDDVYETVTPDYTTQDAEDKLTSVLSEFQCNFYTWRSNYEQEIAERTRIETEKYWAQQQLVEALRRIEAEKRLSQYWAEHAEEKKYYDSRLAQIKHEITSIEIQINEYDSKIDAIEGELSESNPDEAKLGELEHQLSELTGQKSNLGIFARKQKQRLQEQIDDLQLQVVNLKNYNEQRNKAIQDKISAQINAIENECKPYRERLSVLEEERESIIEELTKDR